MNTQRVELVVNNSLLRESSCEYKTGLILFNGYREPMNFNDTQYGTAFHKFMSTMHESEGKVDVALTRAVNIMRKPCNIRPGKEHLNEKHLIPVCLDYWEKKSVNSDFELLINPTAICYSCKGIGKIEGVTHPDNPVVTEIACDICKGIGTRPQPLVETKFKILVTSYKDIDVYVAGTLDEFGKIRNGCYCVGDYKTTSSWKIDEYLASYELSFQLLLYVWAFKKLAAEAPDNSPLKTIARTPIGAMIKGIFLKTKQETTFKDSEVFIPKDWQLAECEELLVAKCYKLAKMYAEYLYNQDIKFFRTGKIESLCYKGFKCKFWNICAAPTTEVANVLLKRNYIQKPYDPLHQDED